MSMKRRNKSRVESRNAKLPTLVSGAEAQFRVEITPWGYWHLSLSTVFNGAHVNLSGKIGIGEEQLREALSMEPCLSELERAVLVDQYYGELRSIYAKACAQIGVYGANFVFGRYIKDAHLREAAEEEK